MRKFFSIVIVILLMVGCGGSGKNSFGVCSSLDCLTSKYNLIMADVDFTATTPTATNLTVIATNSYQDMTHPRVSPDKNWVAYTTYNVTNSDGCASTDSGYADTEIKATKLDGSMTTTLISATAGVLNSNNYWYGTGYDFTFLSGAPGATNIYYAQTDDKMNVIAGPTQVIIPGTILPYDPQANSMSQSVYVGQYADGSNGNAKSVFMQALDAGAMDTPTALSLARDSNGTVLHDNEIFENDPKLSPDGNNVAFMRKISSTNSGTTTGFGWRIFVAPTTAQQPPSEENISASLGDSQLENDTLPEWVDNSTLVFSNISVVSQTDFSRTIYIMQSDGSNRTQVSLPDGYHYSDVYPFVDNLGQQKIIVSAEKISASCTP